MVVSYLFPYFSVNFKYFYNEKHGKGMNWNYKEGSSKEIHMSEL